MGSEKMKKQSKYMKKKKTHFCRDGRTICRVDNKTSAYKKTTKWVYVDCDNCFAKRVNC